MSEIQGQNPVGTPRKQIGLFHLFRNCIRLSKATSRPYWHLDMHAGCGWNHKAECQGSPLTFMDVALHEGKDFRALFCDNHEPAYLELGDRLHGCVEQTDCSAIRVACKDNVLALADFARWIVSEERSDFAVGSILIDPNGFKEEDVPLNALKDFFADHPKIDIILNANVSLFARVRGCKNNPNTPGFDDWPDPRDVFGLEPLKSHWLVRNPPRINGEHFVLFLGRNHPAGMGGFEQFVPLHSTHGEAIVNGLQRVRLDQPNLFEDCR